MREHLKALVHSAALADASTSVYGQGTAELRERKVKEAMAVSLSVGQLAVELRIATYGVRDTARGTAGHPHSVSRCGDCAGAGVRACSRQTWCTTPRPSVVSGWLYEAELAGRLRHAAPMLSTGASGPTFPVSS